MKNKHKNISSIFAIALVLCCGLILSLYNSLDLFSNKSSGISLPSKKVDTQTSLDYNSSYNYGIVLDKDDIELSPENISAVIATLKRPDNYSCEITKTLYYNDISKTTNILQYTIGDYSKIEILDEKGVPQVHQIFGVSHVFIWKAGSKSYYIGAKGSFNSDSAAQIPTYEDIIAIPAKQITKVEYTIYNNRSCIYVEHLDEDTKYITKYWVSIENGLLTEAEIYDKLGILAYAISVDKLVTGNVSNELLRLPDGEFANQIENGNTHN